jgi:hypothetical protein
MKFEDIPYKTIIVITALWIAFGQLNTLKNANKPGGCCTQPGKKNSDGTPGPVGTCGIDGADFVWKIVLTICILGTLHLTWVGLHELMPSVFKYDLLGTDSN